MNLNNPPRKDKTEERMKTKSEIQETLSVLYLRLEEAQKDYNRLHYMDIQSGEGNKIRANINFYKGQIKSLTWILE
jgi:coenzyme F420-reducing hydrogenase delta subunit